MKRKPHVDAAAEASAKGKRQLAAGEIADGRVSELLLAIGKVDKAVQPHVKAYGARMQHGFVSLFKNLSEFSDARLNVGGQMVPSHRIVLASWSPVLHALMTRWIKTSDNAVPTINIELDVEDRYEDFMEVLRYMYTGTCNLHSWNVIPLLRLSNYYEVVALKELCGEFLFELLAERDVALLMTLAEKYACGKAKRLLGVHLAHGFEALLKSGEMLGLSLPVWEDVLRSDSLAVADETAVFDAVAQYVGNLADRPGARGRAWQRLLPCVRLPFLGVDALVQRVESNPMLMAIPGTKDLLYNAFRSLLLVQGAAGTIQAAQAPWRHAPSTSCGVTPDTAADKERLRELMMLQSRPRCPMTAFDPRLSLGFEFLAGRLTATALPAGGLAHGPDPNEVADIVRAGLPGAGRGRRAMAPWRARLGAAPAPPDPVADPPPSTSYAVLTPGVSEGCALFQLRIDAAHANASECAEMSIWVVNNLRVERESGAPEEPDLLYENHGCVYLSGLTSGRPGRVRQVLPPYLQGHSGDTTAKLGRAVYRRMGVPRDRGVETEGFAAGDIIGVAIRLPSPPTPGQALPASPYPHRRSETVLVTFLKNGRPVGKLAVAADTLPPREMVDAIHIAQRHAHGHPRAVGPAAGGGGGRHGGRSGGGGGGGAAGGTGLTSSWRVMVSTRHPGDTVTIMRHQRGAGLHASHCRAAGGGGEHGEAPWARHAGLGTWHPDQAFGPAHPFVGAYAAYGLQYPFPVPNYAGLDPPGNAVDEDDDDDGDEDPGADGLMDDSLGEEEDDPNEHDLYY